MRNFKTKKYETAVAFAKFFMQRYLKKNPPINEQMIKIMMSQMGRTPTQKQVNQMMKAMNNIK